MEQDPKAKNQTKGKVVSINTKLKSAPERATGTRLDVIEITADLLRTWKPGSPHQRPLRVNAKVIGAGEDIKRDGVLPGIITLGIYKGETYVLDGQHRLYAFQLSGRDSAYADVRISHFDSLEAMGEEFVRINSSLVRLRPDDILRGFQGRPPIAYIRTRCPFVGYDMIRRNERAPILSMSAVLRCWRGSESEVPIASIGSAQHVADTLLMEDAETLCEFLGVAMHAWGRDPEYARLWGSLNLTLSMWLYRRMVLTAYSHKVPKISGLLFGKGLMSLSASPEYLDWLGGRQLRESDRSPGYGRLKVLIARRLSAELGRKVMLPQPAWATHIKVGMPGTVGDRVGKDVS